MVCGSGCKNVLSFAMISTRAILIWLINVTGEVLRAVATLDITGDMVVFVGFVEGIWVQIETAHLRSWMKESILCQLFVSIIYKIDKCPY